ncbi:hypothetical protein SAMN06265173_108103 [Thalassovita litoralis]|uniref:Uncharacterized protein n=1 Tax=Thalassovita litoralis TaxID=1010611 RepID=A0A521D2M0_9RHOB|nr:cytochrome c biogenesis protein ResB [Thalassovita litoralis]SMO65271.1 hypothetical protein SAMN06265173_108103 [Thalassovita litoralis]
MASKPTHYRVTVNRPLEHAGARFRPGPRYTLKAKVFDDLKAECPEAIASSEPMNKE